MDRVAIASNSNSNSNSNMFLRFFSQTHSLSLSGSSRPRALSAVTFR